MSAEYASVSSGVAWIILTRAESAVHVQALQRHGKAPRLIDCKILNTVVRYMKRHKIGVWYRNFGRNVELLGFSDSAFKTQEEEWSGRALRGLAISLGPETPLGETAVTIGEATVHLVVWFSGKLKQVVRSTFAMELSALLDTIEAMLLVQMVYNQCYCGTAEAPTQPMKKLESGELYPPIDLLIDARSVLDAVAASEVSKPAEASLRFNLSSTPANAWTSKVGVMERYSGHGG